MGPIIWIDETPRIMTKGNPVISRLLTEESPDDLTATTSTSTLSPVSEKRQPRSKKSRGPRKTALAHESDESLQTALSVSKSLLKEAIIMKRKRAPRADPNATNILPTLEAKKLISQRLDGLLETSHATCRLEHRQLAGMYWDQPPLLSQNIPSGHRFWKETQGLDIFSSAATYSASDFQINVYRIQARREMEESGSSPRLTVVKMNMVESGASYSERRESALPLPSPNASTMAPEGAPASPVKEASQFIDAQRSSILDYYDHLLKTKEMDLHAQIETLIAAHQSWMETMTVERDCKLACLL